MRERANRHEIIDFPARLEACLKLEVWKYERFDRQSSYAPMSFSEFVRAPYPAGLGADYETIRWFLDAASFLSRKYPNESNENIASLCEHLRREIDRLESEAGVIDMVEEGGIMNDADQVAVAAE